MLKKGLIQAYTGTTEQFNFAPIGLALRAAGQNLRTLITCFMDHEFSDAGGVASELLRPNLVIDHTAIENSSPGGSLDETKVVASYVRAKEAIITGNFDIVILNGIHSILNLGVISLKDILALMKEKASNVELVLTGPEAPKEIIERADLVTEIRVSRSKGDRNRVDQGGVEVVTGDGKGKTTYCLGKAFFLSCLGVRSSILQFVKSPRPYGEVKAIKSLPNLDIRTMGEGFLDKKTAQRERKHQDAAKKAWEVSVSLIFSGKYGLIVLDEINIATHYGLIGAGQITKMLAKRPENIGLLLSGRNAHPDVIDAVNTVVEMKEIKHPFQKGIKSRRGIEF